jgi:primosomal replication protein N
VCQLWLSTHDVTQLTQGTNKQAPFNSEVVAAGKQDEQSLD